MLLSISETPDTPGLAIRDHVERRQCLVQTPGPVSPVDVPTNDFYFPVDKGVAIETTDVTLPHTSPVCIRNHAGWMIAELANGESQSFPEDLYSIEISAPIKLYVVVEAPFSVSVSANDVQLTFTERTRVRIGARSYHKNPAATITTSDDPHDMMTAVSYLGSALKTTTCERSYPTLRGHPPTIKLDETLAIPDSLTRPETGVTLELPADYQSVFVAAPLAYYLGANVTEGAHPKLRTTNGFTHSLEDPVRGFEGEVERVLKQVFFLDCLIRTEGYYQVDLHERNAIEDGFDLDYPVLYDQPIVDQLETYLDISYELIEPHLPQWKLTAHVALSPIHVETLPFLINDLAIIRSQPKTPIGPKTPQLFPIGNSLADGGFVRSSTTRSTAESAPTPSLVQIEESNSLEQVWVGPDAPLGASKVSLDAFHNQLNRTPTTGNIEITVVCNDTAMSGERDVVNDVYGSREELPFSVNIHRELTTTELASVLEQDIDFLHYIGHIDANGFDCLDGQLNVSDLEATGVDAFFLNACTSYEQGMRLIEAGAIAGVVTLQDIINSGAERVGKTLARLLNRGFPLQTALNIAKTRSVMGGHYLVVGDGGVDIAQPKGGAPATFDISTDKENFNVKYNSFPTNDTGIGSLTIPYVGDNDTYYLIATRNSQFNINRDELGSLLEKEEMPIVLEGQLEWSNELDTESV